MNFDNLHQILRSLYEQMMPLCGDMAGVAKGIAGLGALFYVAYRVWQSLARAEPIDMFPMLRPFAIGLCIMFFPTVVLGTNTTYLSNVVNHYFKCNFKTLVNRCRVEYAKLLLRKEKRTADELIKLCGFTSRSVFYSAFTKEVGVVPSRYPGNMLPFLSEYD